MSTTLQIVIPFALFAIVSSLCFVGCILDTTGNDFPHVPQYSSDTVLGTESVSAYWRLNESTGSTTAVNSKAPGTADGTYVSQFFPADPPLFSAEAPGTLLLGQLGMLAGDTVPPHDASSAKEPCILVDGAFVKVSWDPVIAPTDSFTLEAWVQVGWGEKEPLADRAVMVSLESKDGYKGFGIRATKDHIWQAFVGNGVDLTFVDGGAVAFGTVHHLVATFANGELKLYINGALSASKMSVTYVPTTGGQMFIGAGGPHLDQPVIPFVGKLQCVAIYNSQLLDADISKHFQNGKDGTGF